jgi:tRNA wybutosine-synthesizing protein 1
MQEPGNYSRLVREGAPAVLELKGYSWLGESKTRLPKNAMPYQSEIRQFAERIQSETGYEITAEDAVSRVVALVRDRSSTRLSLDS